MRFAPREKFEFSNGAIGWRPGGPFDCLGPYAKVEHCPVQGITDPRTQEVLRVTAYATDYADTMFSVPAEFRLQANNRRVRVTGFFTSNSEAPGGVEFVPYDKHVDDIRALLAAYV